MAPYKRLFVLFFCVLLASALCGCAILEIPGQLIGGTFQLVGQLLQLISKLPMPPPGVF